MKWISTVDSSYKVGQVDDEIIYDARQAGLSEIGIESMIQGDVKTFKQQLRLLEIQCPGNIWACTSGYGLWFNAVNEKERRQDYNLINQQLRAYVHHA
jgi:hypothetical protein